MKPIFVKECNTTINPIHVVCVTINETTDIDGHTITISFTSQSGNAPITLSFDDKNEANTRYNEIVESLR